uniref:Uncharacterized protein n=1 Tax=Aegilops tauschii subsp. strangulata TaxID=200361 RepID=A0A453NNL2_AEGTS
TEKFSAESRQANEPKPDSYSETGVRREREEAPAMATPAKEEAAAGQRDELADSLSELFTNVSLMVRGELQGTNNQLSLLEKMNQRVTEEYSNHGDVASGLRVFVEQLNEKNQRFDEYTTQIDAIDQQCH